MASQRAKDASSAWSVSWKQESEKLLNGASTFAEFEEAVIWCGKGGSVTRTVPKQDVTKFADFLYKNKSDIMSGTFSLTSLEPYGGKGGKGGSRPYSWTSKICHIMNPQGYPLIYDGNIRKAHNGGSIKNIKDYEVALEEERKKCAGKSNLEIYKYDSDLWASVL